MPTYSLIDVIRCAKDEPSALAAVISGKVVYIGTTLPAEDRKISSARFISPAAPPTGAKAACGLHRLGVSVADTQYVPGVYLHAIAVQLVLSGRIVTPAAAYITALIAGLAARWTDLCSRRRLPSAR